jgi:hypothetical protein
VVASCGRLPHFLAAPIRFENAAASITTLARVPDTVMNTLVFMTGLLSSPFRRALILLLTGKSESENAIRSQNRRAVCRTQQHARVVAKHVQRCPEMSPCSRVSGSVCVAMSALERSQCALHTFETTHGRWAFADIRPCRTSAIADASASVLQHLIPRLLNSDYSISLIFERELILGPPRQ